MGNLSKMGRIFYSIAIAGMGFQMFYCKGFPYMLLPPNNTLIPGIAILALVFGLLFFLSGACIAFKIKARQAALFLASTLLLIFCFYFIPYQLMSKSSYLHYGEWENAAKELALAAGAFAVAGSLSGKKDNPFTSLPGKAIPLGAALFPITIISFSIDHFLYAKQAADYIPSWIPYHLFWMYFAGVALLGSGIAIIFKIKTPLFAALLGIMIFIWFVSLHIPRVIAAPPADLPGEITSAFLALAYCGIAFVFTGPVKKAAH
jgi:uncharacterized membrane protein YphA (DoxX/SURF4 family)